MKLNFLSLGGEGGGGASLPFPRRLIARRMRQLDIKPLDHADDTIRFGIWVAVAFFGTLILFGMLAPISGAAIAPGEVTIAGDKFVIQPAASGIVGEILVREGQYVRAGQALVRMNGVRAGAQLAQIQARRDALRALEARLIAERDGTNSVLFPNDLASRSADPFAARAMVAQRAIFDQHRALVAADRSTTDDSTVAARARQAASARQLELISDELADYRMLYNKGFARLTTIRSLERTQAQLKAETIAGQAALDQAEIAAKRVRDAQGMDNASQLTQVQEQLGQVLPQLDVTRYLADQDILRAPVAGRVSGVTEMGPGMVLGGGRTLMQIVPTGRPLIVTARIKAQDIDDVRVGQIATVRFSSVNPHGKTAFKGRVVTLSPAKIEDGGTPYYRAEIALENPEAAKREGLVLQPGIPASVNIETKKRTLFSYLFAPLADAMSRSMREE